MKEIKANPLNSKELFSKKEGVPGIYMWGYYEKKNFIPLYVGKSRNIFERLIQHYCRYKGGEYRISPNGKYIPDSFYNILSISPKEEKFRDKVLNNFAFRYIEVPDSEERSDLERQLADLVGRKNLITQISKAKEENQREMLKVFLNNIPSE